MNAVAVQERPRADYGVDYYQKRYSGYALLWQRVYRRAVLDYVFFKKARNIKQRREFECARRWLFDDDGGLDIICALWDLPLGRLRIRAMKMTKAEAKKLEHIERDRDRIRTRVLENGNR